MTTYYSTEMAGTANQTAVLSGYRPSASVFGGRLKRVRGRFTMASQTTSDTLILGTLPAGATFAFGVITTTTSLGSATLAIGIAGTTGKYRAAAVFTATDTPTMFGTALQVGASEPGLSAEETVIGTIAAASLPANGTLIVDLYYSMP